MLLSNGHGATSTFFGCNCACSSLIAPTIFFTCAWPNSSASTTVSSETSSAPDSTIMMVESGALEVSEETVVEALEFGHAQVKKIVGAIKELHAQLQPKKVEVAPWPFDQSIYDSIKKAY